MNTALDVARSLGKRGSKLEPNHSGSMMGELGARFGMMGNIKRKKYSDKLKRNDPFLKKIYSQIIEFDASVVKTKPEKLKVQRN